MDESNRVTAREIANRYLSKGDAFGWFEELYTQANGDASIVPWADLMPNPNLVTWLDNHGITGAGKKALKIGCGLGDDAEELACREKRVRSILLVFSFLPLRFCFCKRIQNNLSVPIVSENCFSFVSSARDVIDST